MIYQWASLLNLLLSLLRLINFRKEYIRRGYRNRYRVPLYSQGSIYPNSKIVFNHFTTGNFSNIIFYLKK